MSQEEEIKCPYWMQDVNPYMWKELSPTERRLAIEITAPHKFLPWEIEFADVVAKRCSGDLGHELALISQFDGGAAGDIPLVCIALCPCKQMLAFDLEQQPHKAARESALPVACPLDKQTKN